MAKGYTDHIDAACGLTQKLLPPDFKQPARPDDRQIYENVQNVDFQAHSAIRCLSQMYVKYRNSGFSHISAVVRVRWALELLTTKALEMDAAPLEDTFLPTSLDVVDAVIDAVADQNAKAAASAL